MLLETLLSVLLRQSCAIGPTPHWVCCYRIYRRDVTNHGGTLNFRSSSFRAEAHLEFRSLMLISCHCTTETAGDPRTRTEEAFLCVGPESCLLYPVGVVMSSSAARRTFNTLAEFADRLRPSWVNGKWRPAAISAKNRARLRRETLLAGE